MFLRGYCLACFRLLNVVANVVSVGFFWFFFLFKGDCPPIVETVGD